MEILILLGLALLGARERQDVPPFHVTFSPSGSGRAMPRRISSFDRALPGYHVDAGIATVRISPRRSRLPRELVLSIATSPGMQPMLEGFSLISPQATVRTSLGAPQEMVEFKRGDPGKSVPAGTYFGLTLHKGKVRVTFLSAALRLLQRPAQVEWVDWYRG